MPVAAEPFADEEGQSGGGDNCRGDGKPRCRGAHAERLVRTDDQPVEEWWLLQTRHAIVGGHEPLFSLQHFFRCTRILPIRFVVEIAGSDGGPVEKRGERDKNNEKRVPRWRRCDRWR